MKTQEGVIYQAKPISGKLVGEAKALIEKQDVRGLEELVAKMRPADAADLIENLAPEERAFVFDLLEPEGAGDVLMEIEPPVQERLLSGLDNRAISEIVEELDSDDAADLLGDLPDERARQIIEAVPDEVSEELEKLLPYPEDTAGGIMALEFVSISVNATVQDAIETIREKREEVENLFYLWITDDDEKLAGVVSMRDLVLAPARRRIGEIMNPDVISTNVAADQEDVVQLVKKYDLVAIPVVDSQNRLVGRITHDDIMDVMEEEADEDISLMAGVIRQEIAEESTFRISRARLPWLIAGLFGGILAAVVIKQFESSLERVLAISFFFPVIMAMGGNTGTQAATVVVRGLANGDIGLTNESKRLLMELRVA
ncbi:MAG: magnesium transporter, partial [Deltaproteobacteria bacterium]|nr:magnesium transporter [Deltaproteobacteria bacterium]